MAKGMPWIPVNMTDERRRRVEAFSRFRRIGRAEAAAILIDAGIEAMRPLVDEELEDQRRRIASAVGVPPSVLGVNDGRGPNEVYVTRLRDLGYFNRDGNVDPQAWLGILRLARKADRA